jgi:chaperone modulatory protein CbpM
MMITETEIVARFGRLEAHVLQRWIAAGWLKPQENGAGFLFDEADVARTHLLCDLSFDMELRDEELRALTAAVQRQPAEIREAILAETRANIGAEPPAP